VILGKVGLLSTKGISKAELLSFFRSVQNFKRRFQSSSSREKTREKSRKESKPNDLSCVGILAFFEPSTRTRVSFESAGLDVGIRWIHLNSTDSSLEKGESWKDTFQTLGFYNPNFFVVRHPVAFLPHFVTRWTNLPVINAGDGQNEHPTQALLDAYTLWEKNPSKRWTICFYGDVARSRVARSNIHLFRALGHKIFLFDDSNPSTKLFAKAFKLSLIGRKKLREMDAVMALRVQKEREGEYENSPLSTSDLGAKTLLLHPGPVILGQDISFDLAADESERNLIQTQVKNGFYVRRCLLESMMATTFRKTRGR